MIKEARKNESLIEKFLKGSDQYNRIEKIDFSTVEHNQMGGIVVKGYVNDDFDIYFKASLSNDYIRDKRQYRAIVDPSIALFCFLRIEGNK